MVSERPGTNPNSVTLPSLSPQLDGDLVVKWLILGLAPTATNTVLLTVYESQFEEATPVMVYVVGTTGQTVAIWVVATTVPDGSVHLYVQEAGPLGVNL